MLIQKVKDMEIKQGHMSQHMPKESQINNQRSKHKQISNSEFQKWRNNTNNIWNERWNSDIFWHKRLRKHVKGIKKVKNRMKENRARRKNWKLPRTCWGEQKELNPQRWIGIIMAHTHSAKGTPRSKRGSFIAETCSFYTCSRGRIFMQLSAVQIVETCIKWAKVHSVVLWKGRVWG